jgi:glycerol-3-phosphate dehydrogenase
LRGGEFSSTTDLLAQAKAHQLDWLSDETLVHLIESYGTNYGHILNYRRENPAWLTPIIPDSPVLQAEIIHAVRCEMAQTLRDVIRRRTPIGAAGLPNATSLNVCADLMTAELGWSFRRRQQEIFAAWASYNQIKPEPTYNLFWQNLYQKSTQNALSWPATQSFVSN